MTKKTTLNALHLESSAKMIDFHGWNMPIHYGSQLREHEFVRNSCGIFDVSHMTILDVEGKDAKEFLKKLLANDVSRLDQEFDCMYSALLNESGGVLDDLIAYKHESGYRLVANCVTRQADINWIESQIINMDVSLSERTDLSMIAIQGPLALDTLSKCFSLEVSNELIKKMPFQGLMNEGTLVTTTGYTGERGVELIIEHEKAKILWKKALLSGAKPIGLGARDTLRLEAGLNLYGFEMDEKISPLECNMAWTVSLKDKKRNFIGKESFQLKKKKGGYPILKGLLFEDRSIVRSNQDIFMDEQKMVRGVVTSGTYSPTLKKSIALARIPPSDLKNCLAEVRGNVVKALVGEPSFVKEGKIVFKN